MNTYQNSYDQFDLSELENLLHGNLNQLNAAVETCDRYANTDKVALYYEGINGEKEVITFKKLKEESSKVANFLTSIGVEKGDAVSGMLPRTPELLYVIIGTWRVGGIYQPLFTAFGPKAIEQRLDKSHSKIVFTDEVNRPKIHDVANHQPLVCVLVRTESYQLAEADYDFRKTTALYSSEFEPVMLSGEDPFMMLSTSGTTGLPKAVPVPLFSLLAFRQYMELAVDLREEDNFWNLADPGWAYGLYYSVTGPLLTGHALTFYEGGFTAEDTYRIIKEYNITSLAGSPTAFRLLIGAGEEKAQEIRGQLRTVSSAGEALNPEVVRWFREHLDAPILDHYGQTETGMVVNNHHALEHFVKAGSMGYAMPGYRVAILDDAGNEVEPGTTGILAVDIKNSPILWFNGYLNTETPAISGGYYRTGDSAEQSEDGLVTFVGRHDDVITSSGYRIGPFDVESALMEHPAVLETAVIGKPDPERTEIVKAYVVLNKGHEPSDALIDEMSLFVKKSLAAHAYPKEIEFIDELPKTPSGKIQRFILKNMEKDRVRV